MIPIRFNQRAFCFADQPGTATRLEKQSSLFRFSGLVCWSLVSAIMLGTALLPEMALADEQDGPASEAGAKPDDETGNGELLKGLLEMLQQPADSEYKIRPSAAETDEEVRKRREALSYYMAGRSHEHDNEFEEAYEAYRKAIEIDDDAIALYRAIIPLAFRLDQTDQAIAYAQKAVKLDPDNFELLSQLGIYALRQQDLLGSIKYFEKAIESDTVDKKAGPYLSIMSQLGTLYQENDQLEDAARTFAIVFDAITNPDDYSIDFRTRRALETMKGDKKKTFVMFGELFLATDRFDLAEKAYQLAAKASRKNPEVFDYLQARILAKKEASEEALKRLQSYFDAKLDTEGKGPYLLLKELLVATDQLDEIVPRLEEMVDKDPANETLRLYLAEQYIEKGMLGKAEKIYQELKGTGNKGEIQLGLLKIYRQQGKAEETLQALTEAMMNGANPERLEAELDLLGQKDELCKKIIALGKDDEQTPDDEREAFTRNYLLAKLAMRQEQVDDVISFYKSAMALREERRVLVTLYAELVDYLNNEEEYGKLTDVLKEAINSPALTRERQAFQLQLVQTFAEEEKYELAIELIQEIQETEPDSLLWKYQEGRMHYLNQNWEQTVRLFLPLLEKAEEQRNSQLVREMRYNLSRSLAFLGKTEEALKLIEQAREDEPKESLWKFQQAWVHYYSRNWPEAISAFKKMIEEDNGSNESILKQAKYSLSAAYAQNDQLDKAEEVLEAIYEKEPDNISVCNDLGYLYADRGKKLDQAYRMIQKALKEEPDNHAYLDSMGWVLYRMERYEEALTYLQKAVEDSEEGDAVLWDHLGDCYQAMGKTEKAREAWRKALEQEEEAQFKDTKLISKLKDKLNSE